MGSDFSAVVSMLWFIIVMLLIFAGAYYASKVMGRHYTMQAVSSATIRVADKLAIGRDQYLLIVEAGGKAFLIGVSPGHMETVAELDPEMIIDAPLTNESADFLSLLKRWGKRPDNEEERE